MDVSFGQRLCWFWVAGRTWPRMRHRILGIREGPKGGCGWWDLSLSEVEWQAEGRQLGLSAAKPRWKHQDRTEHRFRLLPAEARMPHWVRREGVHRRKIGATRIEGANYILVLAVSISQTISITLNSEKKSGTQGRNVASQRVHKLTSGGSLRGWSNSGILLRYMAMQLCWGRSSIVGVLNSGFALRHATAGVLNSRKQRGISASQEREPQWVNQRRRGPGLRQRPRAGRSIAWFSCRYKPVTWSEQGLGC